MSAPSPPHSAESSAPAKPRRNGQRWKGGLIPVSLVLRSSELLCSAAASLLLVYCVLSWLTAPDAPLQHIRVATWTYETIGHLFGPSLHSIGWWLPNGGMIEHPSQNGFYIDFTPWVLMLGLFGIRLVLSRIDDRISS